MELLFVVSFLPLLFATIFICRRAKGAFCCFADARGAERRTCKIETDDERRHASEARAEARPEARAQNEQWKDAAAVKTSTAACLAAGGNPAEKLWVHFWFAEFLGRRVAATGQ